MALFSLFVVSCSNEEDLEEDLEGSSESDSYVDRDDSSATAQTTIMYFLGTSLSSFFSGYNIPDTQIAVAAGALGDNGRLLIFMPSYSSATLYEIYKTTDGYATEVVATYVEDYNYKSSSLSGEYLLDVIAKSQEFAPANTYNLIMSGHGTGWVLSTHTSLKSTIVSDISSDINWDNMGTGDVVTRYIGSTSDGFLNIEELSDVLDQTSTVFGYILFDMCFMSNIETLYELKDVCDNVISSPCEVMGDGFPYQTILPELFAESGKSTDYSGACYAYYDHYNDHYSTPYGAVAWCVTSELDNLASVMKRINDNGVESVSISSLQCYEALSTHVFCDLGDYVSHACVDDELLSDFESAMNSAFPAEGRYHTGQFLTTLTGSSKYVDIDDDHFSGVSTSEPSTKYTSEWEVTSWAVATAAQ